MGALENPVVRLWFIFGSAFLATSAYITITGFLPGLLQWFPFGTYPSIGSVPYIIIFTVAAFLSGVLWWFAFFIHARRVKSNLMANARVSF